MIGLAIQFELGRYHANPWGEHVNDSATEWPPSPWRVLRAIYAVARTNVPLSSRQSAIDRALAALAMAPPPRYELPPVSAGHSRHYVPKSTFSAVKPGTDKIIDGFAAMDPAAETRIWWDVSLDEEAADALASAARCLGYLGRSESVCSARMISGAGPVNASAVPATPDDFGREDVDLVDLLCPEPNDALAAMAQSVTELRRQRRLLPPGARFVPYAVARAERHPAARRSRAEPPAPTLALFRIAGSHRPAMVDAVAVGQALRSSLQSLYGRANRGGASPTFSGRAGDRARTDQHRHAHYLSLPDGHGPRVDRLVVWAPEGFGPKEVAALTQLTYVTLHGIPERLPAALAALGPTSDLSLPSLLGPARRWRFITPFGLVRHPKRRAGGVIDGPEDQLRRELSMRSLPEPTHVELVRGSWHRFRSSKVGSSRLDRASVIGLRVRFAEPLRGPLAVGAFSHFGLGLAVPEE